MFRSVWKIWLDNLEMLLDALGDLNDQASFAALLDEFGLSAKAVPFNRATHDALCETAETALGTLMGLKRYWR